MFTTFEELLKHLRTHKDAQTEINVSAKDKDWAIVAKYTRSQVGILFCWNSNDGKSPIGDWKYLSFTKNQLQEFREKFIPAYEYLERDYKERLSNI